MTRIATQMSYGDFRWRQSRNREVFVPRGDAARPGVIRSGTGRRRPLERSRCRSFESWRSRTCPSGSERSQLCGLEPCPFAYAVDPTALAGEPFVLTSTCGGFALNVGGTVVAAFSRPGERSRAAAARIAAPGRKRVSEGEPSPLTSRLDGTPALRALRPAPRGGPCVAPPVRLGRPPWFARCSTRASSLTEVGHRCQPKRGGMA